MKKVICFFLLSFIAVPAICQQTRFGAAYNYLYAPQWDHALQTYNFSRPFLDEKQPLLMHGIGGYFSRVNRHGFECAWHYFRSSAENPGLRSVFNLHFIEVGYIYHRPIGSGYFDAGIAAIGGFLMRRENGSLMKIDDKYPFAAGIGAKLSLRYIIQLNVGAKGCVCPFAGIGYSPYFFSPYNEGLLNQTKGLTGKSSTGILNLELGIYFTRNLPDKSKD